MSSDDKPEIDKPAQSGGILGMIAYVFGLGQTVTPRSYAAWGFSLMALKYGVEAGLIRAFAGKVFTPLDFVNPVLTLRERFFEAPAPAWLPWFLFVWTLPFLWIAVSMSVRRSANAGIGALGLAVLLPFLNIVVMLALCLVPERNPQWSLPEDRSQFEVSSAVRSALWGVLASVALSVVLVLLFVYALGDYGSSLFLGAPILVGALSSYIYNRPRLRGLGESLGVAGLSILISGASMLLFAFEGVICLAMLAPLAGAMGLLGGLVGWAFAAVSPRQAPILGAVIVALPILSGAEHAMRKPHEFQVTTEVDIDAPPEVVWNHVAGFSELPPPPEWYFQLGVAYPMRARLEGQGVGAVRRCEFSTGAFVEPITEWNRPHRLAFDVASQPPPMHELSPYRHVHPPHLDGYLRCQRGEFRLEELPDGGTRLIGTTWYEFDIYPQDYWTLWSDLCIHQIHLRVLHHIRRLAERDALAASTHTKTQHPRSLAHVR